MPVTVGKSATNLLLTPAGARSTALGDPNVVPSKADRHNVPSVHAVYTVPDSMNAPRACPHAVLAGGSVPKAPAVAPSNGRLLSPSSVRLGAVVAPHAPTDRAAVPSRPS